jgi:hypothetical protein
MGSVLRSVAYSAGGSQAWGRAKGKLGGAAPIAAEVEKYLRNLAVLQVQELGLKEEVMCLVLNISTSFWQLMIYTIRLATANLYIIHDLGTRAPITPQVDIVRCAASSE